MKPVAVVPAFCEEATIGDVVRVLRDAGVFERVIVVDDGSTDATAHRAREAGAEVLTLRPNGGKGQAMLAGAQATSAPVVAFFDADLLGLRPEHVRRMAAISALGYDMVCGVRDYGVLNSALAVVPLITGQRFVSRKVLDAVPADCWDGYAIETALNHAANRVRARTVLTVLPGLWSRQKSSKVGLVGGAVGEVKMLSTIRDVQARLDCDGRCKL
jgi:glycosyltransferase involved in cell wall biosynthesis